VTISFSRTLLCGVSQLWKTNIQGYYFHTQPISSVSHFDINTSLSVQQVSMPILHEYWWSWPAILCTTSD